MTDDDYLQIDQAVRGMISGTLAEWPKLRDALRRQKISLPPETRAATVAQICRLLLIEAEIYTGDL